ncbi:unnamed protein product [Brassica oleracea]
MGHESEMEHATERARWSMRRKVRKEELKIIFKFVLVFKSDHKAGYKRDQTKSGEEVGGLHGPLRASSHIIVSQVDLTTSQKFVRIKRKRKLPRRRGCKSCITMEITNQDEYREIMGRGRESYEEK